VAKLPGVETTADLNTETIAAFLRERPDDEHPNTTHGYLSYLRAACGIAAAEGFIPVSPFAVRRRWIRKLPPKSPRVHSLEEIARVLELAESEVRSSKGWDRWKARRLQALMATVAFCGLRRSEALHLCTEDIEHEHQMVVVRPRVGNRLKTEGSAQPVPVPDALVPILTSWLLHRADKLPPGIAVDAPGSALREDGSFESWLNVPGDKKPDVTRVSRRRGRHAGPVLPPQPLVSTWIFPNTFGTGPWLHGAGGHRPGDRLRQLGERAGVPDLTFQSLRHTWATHAESAWGLPPAVIQRVLRHSNATTQNHYRHAERRNLSAMVGGIDFRPRDAT
jgi:integrase